MEQELFTNQEHLSSPPVFSGVRNTQSLVFCLVFCRSFVVLLSFCLFNPLYWLSFLDFWLLITPLVYSKNSYLKTISLINMHAYYIFRIHRFDKKKRKSTNWKYTLNDMLAMKIGLFLLFHGLLKSICYFQTDLLPYVYSTIQYLSTVQNKRIININLHSRSQHVLM